MSSKTENNAQFIKRLVALQQKRRARVARCGQSMCMSQLLGGLVAEVYLGMQRRIARTGPRTRAKRTTARPPPSSSPAVETGSADHSSASGSEEAHSRPELRMVIVVSEE